MTAAALTLPQAELPWQRFSYAPATTHFAQAIGAARSGQLELARTALQKLDDIHAGLVKTPIAGPYDWTSHVEAMRLTAAAWLAWGDDRKEEALKLARSGADLDDTVGKHAVTPGSVLPPRELLGDMLLELGRPAEALAEYEASLRSAPNRFNGLYGAAHAAELSGDKVKARQYYSQLVANCGPRGTRRELQHARAFLGKAA